MLKQENVMRKCCYLLMLSGLLVAAGNAFAEEKEEKSPWTSSVELGFVKTTGNTETQNIVGKANVVYEVEKWRHTGYAEGYGSESANQTTGENEVSAERYQLRGKSDYKFTERDYVYLSLKLTKDRFSGFEYDHVLSAGYGRKAIKQENMELDLEIGPGERFFKVDDGQADEEAVLRLAANYWWQISASSKFTQILNTEIGEDITSSESITGIQAAINKTLALKFTYTIRNKSKVPDGTEKNDTEAAMSLVYNF
jgi:putative salt-induced outer membrane protein